MTISVFSYKGETMGLCWIMEVGPSPPEEDCLIQTGPPYYHVREQLSCAAACTRTSLRTSCLQLGQ